MKWEKPTEHGLARHNWLEIAHELKEHPGEWALVAENIARTYVTHIKRGKIKAFSPPGAFEAISRGYGEEPARAAKLYARYTGK